MTATAGSGEFLVVAPSFRRSGCWTVGVSAPLRLHDFCARDYRTSLTRTTACELNGLPFARLSCYLFLTHAVISYYQRR
jgi:hypothetical protein